MVELHNEVEKSERKLQLLRHKPHFPSNGPVPPPPPPPVHGTHESYGTRSDPFIPSRTYSHGRNRSPNPPFPNPHAIPEPFKSSEMQNEGAGIFTPPQGQTDATATTRTPFQPPQSSGAPVPQPTNITGQARNANVESNLSGQGWHNPTVPTQQPFVPCYMGWELRKVVPESPPNKRKRPKSSWKDFEKDTLKVCSEELYLEVASQRNRDARKKRRLLQEYSDMKSESQRNAISSLITEQDALIKKHDPRIVWKLASLRSTTLRRSRNDLETTAMTIVLKTELQPPHGVSCLCAICQPHHGGRSHINGRTPHLAFQQGGNAQQAAGPTMPHMNSAQHRPPVPNHHFQTAPPPPPPPPLAQGPRPDNITPYPFEAINPHKILNAAQQSSAQPKGSQPSMNYNRQPIHTSLNGSSADFRRPVGQGMMGGMGMPPPPPPINPQNLAQGSSHNTAYPTSSSYSNGPPGPSPPPPPAPVGIPRPVEVLDPFVGKKQKSAPRHMYGAFPERRDPIKKVSGSIPLSPVSPSDFSLDLSRSDDSTFSLPVIEKRKSKSKPKSDPYGYSPSILSLPSSPDLPTRRGTSHRAQSKGKGKGRADAENNFEAPRTSTRIGDGYQATVADYSSPSDSIFGSEKRERDTVNIERRRRRNRLGELEENYAPVVPIYQRSTMQPSPHGAFKDPSKPSGEPPSVWQHPSLASIRSQLPRLNTESLQNGLKLHDSRLSRLSPTSDLALLNGPSLMSDKAKDQLVESWMAECRPLVNPIINLPPLPQGPRRTLAGKGLPSRPQKVAGDKKLEETKRLQ